MNNKLLFSFGFLLFLTILSARYLYAEKMRLGLVEEIGSSIEVPDSIKSNLKDNIRERLINSGKFDIIVRSEKDLKKLFEEQKFSSERIGRVDNSDDKKAEFRKISGIEYMASITINDFYDGVEASKFKKVGTPEKYIIRLGVNLKIINSSTGNIKLGKSITAKEFKEKNSYYSQGGSADQELVNKTIASLSNKITQRIIDELYPIKVLDKTGNSVFINRGKEHGIKQGNVLEVFAIKKTTDEDTQEEVNLEYSVGKIKVVNVSDKTSQAEIVEDFGINKGCIAKIAESKEPSETQKIEGEIGK